MKKQVETLMAQVRPNAMTHPRVCERTYHVANLHLVALPHSARAHIVLSRLVSTHRTLPCSFIAEQGIEEGDEEEDEGED